MGSLSDMHSGSGQHYIMDAYSYGVVYIYSIPDDSHKGRVKIGAATYGGNIVDPLHLSPEEQNGIDAAARKRIDQQTKTSDIRYELEGAYVSITNDGKYFSDYTVHDILKRSGFERKSINTKNDRSEWFEISPALAKEAVQAAVDGKRALSSAQINNASKIEPIELRPNQKDAINRTIKAINSGRKSYLWNAKMRFGKTIAAMMVAKESNILNPDSFKKVLIFTHRPSVNVDWYTDFKKVFFESDTQWEYSSRNCGDTLKSRLQKDKPFIYFASLQDLRLSKVVVDDREASHSRAKGFEKNEEVFNTEWDMVIIDEAHEGTQSNLGNATISKIHSKFILQLSGTPFNILHKFEDKEVYTWDYVMEQDEKIHWDERHPGKPNPYAELPALSMLTYEIDKYMGGKDLPPEFTDAMNGAFNFREMFRVERDEDGNEIAEFVHSEMVDKFLDLLVDDRHNFPYSTEEYRKYNKHTMWLLPNRVKIIEAMEKKLKKHPIFGHFGIVNISGNMSGDDEQDHDAKKRVEDAIKNYEYTITLTGQRLTVGASIKQWTAVLMMSDTDKASTYLQAAFRCQTPAIVDGKLKTHGYVFDFAPDRTLKLVAEAVEVNRKRTTSPEQKEAMSNFLNFCPIIAATDGEMKEFSVSTMLEQLKNAIVERVRRNGFDDPKLYNDELLKLTEIEIKKFNDLKAIVGASTGEKLNNIEINQLGMDDAQIAGTEGIERKPKKELTPGEKEALKKLREAREQKRSAISILRGISIRMPMLVYGAINDIDGTPLTFDEDISLAKFVKLVDDESWEEFMPDGLTKDKFGEFIKYYDEDVFRGVTKSIRAKAFDCDELLPYDRVQAIAEIFSSFKNPDKETVLTPWKVVNMHIAGTLGGYDFNNTSTELEGLPEFVERKPYSNIWKDGDTTILEINSKSGLYPLLATYNIYQSKLPEFLKNSNRKEDDCFRELWNKILEEQIFVLCKTPMAKTITERTLAGYTGAKVNVVYIHDLTKKLRNVKDGEKDYSSYSLKDELCNLFNIKGEDMKFTAVVGNPPYQEVNENNKMSRSIYPDFVDNAVKIGEKVSLIMPARWMSGEAGPYKETSGFVSRMKKYGIRSFTLYPNSQDVFSGVDIKGGVCYFILDRSYVGPTNYTYVERGNVFRSEVSFNNKLDSNIVIRFPELASIVEKIDYGIVDRYSTEPLGSMKTLVSSRNPYGFISDLFTKNNEGVSRISEKPMADDDWKIIGLLQGKRVFRYIPNEALKKNKEGAKAYKVLVPRANGSGAFGEVFSTPMLGTPMLGTPMLIATDTFLQVGQFDNKYEASSLLKYIKTKFFRAMVGVKKVAVFNYKDAFTFVPLQDFTENSDIDWNKSVSEIDKQLYKKYGLDEKEIAFIEQKVAPME